MRLFLITWFMLLGLATPLLSQETKSVAPFHERVDLEPLSIVAVWSDGRVRSLPSHTAGVMKSITGGKEITGQSDTFTYLDMMFRSQRYDDLPAYYVKKKPIRGAVSDEFTRSRGASLTAVESDAILKFRATGLAPRRLLLSPPVVRLLSRMESDVMRFATSVEAIQLSLALSEPPYLRGSLAVVPPGEGVADPTMSPWQSIDDLMAHQARGIQLPGEGELDRATRGAIIEAWSQLQQAWIAEDALGANDSITTLAAVLPSVNTNPDVYPSSLRLKMESLYFKWGNLTWIWPIYLLAVVFLVLAVVYRWPLAGGVGLTIFAIALGLHTGAVGWRFWVAQRWPNSNMFEAITTAAWFGAVFALVMEMIVRRTMMRWIFAMGASVACMVALMAVRLYPLDLSSTFSNRMPVLHDVWLYIHTNVIIFSYCLVFVASVTGSLYLLGRLVGWMGGRDGKGDFARVGGAGSLISIRPDGSRYLQQEKSTLGQVLDGTTMVLVELSFIFLWAGIVMGAIWADHSWGRPWGWDPKEVFALNTFIIFIVLIHVRLRSKDKGLWTAILAVIGCVVMLFNWIVINFTISGLHSYA
jgi:cytochrome c-type biogenesis protein CcsB